MITLTYTFNTDAELAAHIARLSVKATPFPAIDASAVPVGKPVKDAAAPVEKPKASPPPAPAAAPAASAPSADTAKSDAPAKVERATVSKAAVALALKDKTRATEILAQFGAKGVKDVPDDKLAEVYPLLTAALEG